MRILLLTLMPPDPRAPGAIPVLLHAELEGLAERHDVTLVTVAGPERHELEAVRRLAAAGIDVHAAERRPLQGRARWARRRRLAETWLAGRWPLRTVWFSQPRVQTLVDRLTARTRFDVVLAEDNAMSVYRLPDGPLRVLTEHEVRRPRPVARPPRSPRAWPSWALREADWRRWPRFEVEAWRAFDLVQVFTERDAQAVRSLAPDLDARVFVNPFGLAVPPHRDVAAEPGTVGFLGNYTHLPNVDAALWLGREIFPRVRALHPAARLLLAGVHAPREVRGLAGDGVEVLGHVADAEELMRRCAVVLAPVRIGGGMRMKVLHAMALGRPVVTTPRGTDGLGIGGRPPVLVAQDAEGLARATAGLLADGRVGAELGAAARRYVEEHLTPRGYAARFEARCEQALERRS